VTSHATLKSIIARSRKDATFYQALVLLIRNCAESLMAFQLVPLQRTRKQQENETSWACTCHTYKQFGRQHVG